MSYKITLWNQISVFETYDRHNQTKIGNVLKYFLPGEIKKILMCLESEEFMLEEVKLLEKYNFSYLFNEKQHIIWLQNNKIPISQEVKFEKTLV